MHSTFDAFGRQQLSEHAQPWADLQDDVRRLDAEVLDLPLRDAIVDQKVLPLRLGGGDADTVPG